MDREHEAKMKEIEINHKEAMSKIETQTELENTKHNEIMKQIEEQAAKLNETGEIDLSQLSGQNTLSYWDFCLVDKIYPQKTD